MEPEEIVKTAKDAGLDSVVIKTCGFSRKVYDWISNSCKKDSLPKFDAGIEVKMELGSISIDFLTPEEYRAFAGLKGVDGIHHFSDLYKKIKDFKDAGSRLMLCLQCSPRNRMFYELAEFTPLFDYTEINPNSKNAKDARTAVQLAGELNLPVVLSSDAHYAKQIGKYYTETDEKDAREAINKRSIKLPFEPESINYCGEKIYSTAHRIFDSVAKPICSAARYISDIKFRTK
jgi:hypothetical protein